MTALRSLLVIALASTAGTRAAAQDFPPKPGPEHDVLKKWVGTWDCTVKMMGMETKGTSVYKMEVGGLWLTSAFEGEFAGVKFSGRGLDSWDPAKKKYVGVWVDSFTTSPMTLEGSFDKDKKTMTMTGTGPGQEGKDTKYKMVSEWKDDDTVNFAVYMGDAKEPGFTITYKRKK